RVDDHRAPAGADAGRVLADLVGGDDERLALDGPRAQQDLPVVARGRERERGRHADDLRAAHGEDAVELREADVVTDAQPEARAAGGLREDARLARRLVLGLLVDAPADLHVEHVDLAVGRAQLAVRADVDGRVAPALVTLDALGEAARDEVDPELARQPG